MADFNQYIGKKFNRLTILEIIKNDKDYNRKCRCKCDCGKEVITRLNPVLKGKTKSCGCYKHDFVRQVGQNNRVFKLGQPCSCCGATPIYAKGLCRSCYTRYLYNDGVVTPTKEQRLLEKQKKKEESFGLTKKSYKVLKKLEQGVGMKFHTEKQKIIFDKIINEKKSEVDIAKELGISRQAVGTTVQSLLIQIDRISKNKVCKICGKVLYTQNNKYCTNCLNKYVVKKDKETINGFQPSPRKVFKNSSTILCLEKYDGSFELNNETEKFIHDSIINKNWSPTDVKKYLGLTNNQFIKHMKSIRNQIKEHRGI